MVDFTQKHKHYTIIILHYISQYSILLSIIALIYQDSEYGVVIFEKVRIREN